MSGPSADYITVTLSLREFAITKYGLRLAAAHLREQALAAEAQGADDRDVIALRDSVGCAEDVRDRLNNHKEAA